MSPAEIRPIRLLYFVREAFPTHRVDVETLFGVELPARGHTIDFVMQAATPEVRTGRQSWNGSTVWIGRTDGGQGFVHRARKNLLGLWHDLRSLALISRERYDAVQVRDKFLVGTLALAVARMKGVRFFFWLSFPLPEGRLARARTKAARYRLFTYLEGALSYVLLYRLILPWCDHAFVQSQRMRADIAAHGIDARKLTPVPMGIAAQDVPPAGASRTAHHDPARTLTVAYLGTLNAQRQLGILVDILSLLRRQGLNVRLLIIGDGDRPPERAAIESRARQLGVDSHLEITGFLPRPAALARLQGVDVALSPFFPTALLLSTSPTKLVEYLALEIPVVANNHPEQRMALRECRAGVCVPWGARHFARAVRWLLLCSAQQRIEMGARGRDWVIANRTYGRIAERLEAQYLSLLAHG